jgi:hypothetical protein
MNNNKEKEECSVPRWRFWRSDMGGGFESPSHPLMDNQFKIGSFLRVTQAGPVTPVSSPPSEVDASQN